MFPAITSHPEVVAILHAPQQWSNQVSAHLQVPNGMDPPEHGIYRGLIEPFFTVETLATFEPVLCEIATHVLANLPANFDPLHDLGYPFSLRAQCAFMGWPAAMEQQLLSWVVAQRAATDRTELSQLAQQFHTLVISQLAQTSAADHSVTARLMNLQVDGQPLSSDYLVSIIRTWTVGELATLANAVASVVQFLQQHEQIREVLRADPTRIDAAVDEILRIHAPLAANRRLALCPAQLSCGAIAAGTVVSLDWAAANRDPLVFDDPLTFHWDRNPEDNLLYGTGIHVCPGAPLARMELRALVRELLQRSP